MNTTRDGARCAPVVSGINSRPSVVVVVDAAAADGQWKKIVFNGVVRPSGAETGSPESCTRNMTRGGGSHIIPVAAQHTFVPT